MNAAEQADGADGDEAEDQQCERDDVVIDRCLTVLMEHFEAVRVFVTRPSKVEGNTMGRSKGRGNYYAQKGMVDDWLRAMNQPGGGE